MNIKLAPGEKLNFIRGNQTVSVPLEEEDPSSPTENELALGEDTELSPIYSDTPPTFSEWTFADVDPAGCIVGQPEWVDGEEPHWSVKLDGTIAPTTSVSVFYPFDALNMGFDSTIDGEHVAFTATRTRTDILGYTLGKQVDKPLLPMNGLWVDGLAVNAVSQKQSANDPIVGGSENRSISQSAIVTGMSNVAGLRGYKYTNTGAVTNSLEFDVAPDGWAVGDVVSVINDSKYADCATIASISGNIVTFTENLPFSSIVDESDWDSKVAYVSAKPDKGNVDLGYGAHAEGVGTKALNAMSHAEGRETKALGQYAHAEGRETEALYCAHAEGRRTKALGNDSHAEGGVFRDTTTGTDTQTIASGTRSHAEGEGSLASGVASHSEGRLSKATADVSHAEGNKTEASGNNSHAEGYETVASGAASHAEGVSTIAGVETAAKTASSDTADGKFTHAEGNGTLAHGNSSHAEGKSTVSNGRNSHTEGANTRTEGVASHAEGYQTRTSNRNEHAEGCFNKSNKASDEYGNAGNTLHSIGIGTSDANRKNAVEVMQDGKVFVKDIGGYDGKNPTGQSNAAEDLATVINGKASIADTTIKDLEFSEWTINGLPEGAEDVALQWDMYMWYLTFNVGSSSYHSYASDPRDVVEIDHFFDGNFDDSNVTATRTRTGKKGYQLGSQSYKLLAPEAEVAENRNAIATLKRTKADKTDLAPLSQMLYIGGGMWVFSDNGDGFVVINGTATTLPSSKTSFGVSEYQENYGLTYVYAPNATSIGNDAFNGCTSLTTVSLPAAESIGGWAFSGCTALTAVSLPTATSIGNAAFNGCTSLTTVLLPAATSIGIEAFYNCSALTAVSLPAATSIGNDAFGNCSSLTTVSLPAAESIGGWAFSGCTALTAVSLFAATTINDGAFFNTALTSILLPAATTIGINAFRECTSLASVSLPAAETIGGAAFYDCTSLTAVSLPAATSISGSVFGNCEALTTVSLPAATTFGQWAFVRCTALTTVSLPAATTFGSNAFLDCTSLSDLDLSSFTKADILDKLSDWAINPPSGHTITITASDETFTITGE